VTLGPATVLFALPERDEKLEAMLMKNHRDDKEARFEKKKKESVGVDDREDFERTKRKNTEEMLAEMRRVASSKS